MSDYTFSDASSAATAGSVLEVEAKDIAWPPKYAPLRLAILHIISHPNLHGRRVDVEVLKTALNTLSEDDLGEKILEIDEKLIKQAISRMDKEFIITFDNLGIEGFEGDQVFYARNGKRYGKKKKGSDNKTITDFGVYDGVLEAFMDVDNIDGTVESDVVTIITRQPIKAVPVDVKKRLQNYLKELKTDKDNRAKRGDNKSKSAKEKKKKKGTKRKAADIQPEALQHLCQIAEAERAQLTEEERVEADEQRKKARLEETVSMMEQYKQKRDELNTLRSKLKERLSDDRMADLDKRSGNANANNNDDNGTKDTMYYIRNAQLGKLELDNSDVILKQELDDGMLKLPPEIDNPNAARTRERTNYDPVQTGASMNWVPRTHELKIKNRQGQIESDQDIVKKIKKLFERKISGWSHEAKRIMTVCNMFGYGCSDEGTIMIMAGTIKALFVMAGIEIDDELIGKALMSRATLANMEAECAADCVIGWCQEMKDDEATDHAMMCDHGHREFLDHFVKLVIWAGKGADDQWTLKFRIIDIVS